MRAHQKRRAPIAKVGLAATIAVGMLLCSQYVGCQRKSQVPKSSRVTECRVSFPMGVKGRAFAEVCLDDESLINDLVLQPMRNAKRDPRPAEYAIVGTLTINLTDKPRENLILFYPWGHYRRGDEYWVADLSELQTACEAALGTAQRRMASVRGYEQHLMDTERDLGQER